MKKPSRTRFLLLIPLLILAAVLIYQIPFVNQRLSWRFQDLKTRLIYAINPPDEAIFVPLGETPQTTPFLAATPDTPEPTPDQLTPEITPEPERTSIPIPEHVMLDDVVYVSQSERWNYCGPANLSMALNFWGWPGDRDDVAAVIKPGIDDPDLDFIQQGRLDKNVMPSEMIGFVVEETDFNIVVRYGGDLELIKTMIANGYPVLVEKGYYERDYTGKVAWLGHYMFTTGYDDQTGEFIVQDSNILKGNTAADHQNKREDYKGYLEGWRSFNYLFMVIYPPDRQDQVFGLLGNWADPAWGYQHALETAEEEIQTLAGVDAFFAWFNKGTSLVKQEHYLDAGEAYDSAFQVYEGLVNDDATRPYRITWYQTTPYMAYYFSGRYQDVINLANFTLDTIAEPTLEETLYWRGLAHYALGDKEQARADFYQSVWLNPHFEAGLIQIGQLNFDE
ncbi:MAG: C39 family peptidase [Chloroflexi bacterium]|nr:C39 family peptidase [Chloroflexota bacterium]